MHSRCSPAPARVARVGQTFENALYLIEVLVAKIKSVSSLGTPDQPTAWAAVALGGDGRCYGTLINSKAGAYGQFVYAEFPVGTQCLGRVATPDTVTSPNYPGN